MTYSKITRLLLSAAILLIAGCGGVINATIGGTVTGLSGGTSVGLLDNGVDALTVGSNGTFTFASQIQAGSVYNVTVATQPTGETCSVENGVGTVEQDTGNVGSVVIACQVNISSNNIVFGTITGLAAGNSVTLVNNGTDSVTENTNGPFLFSTALAVGATYDVVVSVQPSAPVQNCTVTNGVGQLTASGTVTAVGVTCQ